MFTIRQALRKTQDYYGVKGTDLAEAAGIGTPHLASIRSGKSWPSEQVLMRLIESLEVLAPGSRRYFCDLLAGLPTIAVEELGDEQLGELVVRASDELARRLIKSSRVHKNTVETCRELTKA